MSSINSTAECAHGFIDRYGAAMSSPSAGEDPPQKLFYIYYPNTRWSI
jgi:hypothetical protein